MLEVVIASVSRGPRVKLMNNADLGPVGSKARSVELRKAIEKPVKKAPESEESKGKKFEGTDALPKSRSPVAASEKYGGVVPSILRQQQDHRSLMMRPNLSPNASCSSDASTDSSHSRASTTGKLSHGSVTPTARRKKQFSSPKVVKAEKIGKTVGEAGSLSPSPNPSDAAVVKKSIKLD